MCIKIRQNSDDNIFYLRTVDSEKKIAISTKNLLNVQIG